MGVCTLQVPPRFLVTGAGEDSVTGEAAGTSAAGLPTGSPPQVSCTGLLRLCSAGPQPVRSGVLGAGAGSGLLYVQNYSTWRNYDQLN